MMITNIICITFVILSSIILGIVLQLKKELETNQLKVLNHLQEVLKHLKEVVEDNKTIINFNKDIIERNDKLTNLLVTDINIISFNVKHIKEKIKKL